MTTNSLNNWLTMNSHFIMLGGFLLTIILCILLIYKYPNGNTPIDEVILIIIPVILGVGILLAFGFRDMKEENLTNGFSKEII